MTRTLVACLVLFASGAAADEPLPRGAVARLGTTRFALIGPYAFSADSRSVISLGDGAILTYDLATADVKSRVAHVEKHGRQGVLSGDGKIVVGLDDIRGVAFRDATTGGKLATVNAHLNLWLVPPVTNRDGRWFACHGYDGTIHLVNRDGRSLTAKMPEPVSTSLAFLALTGDGKRLAAGAGGTAGYVFDTETGKEILRLPSRISTVAFSPDGTTLAAGELGGTKWFQRAADVKLFDAATGKELAAVPVPPGNGFRSVAFSPDAKLLAAAAFDAAFVIDLAAGRVRHTLPGGLSNVSFTPDGTRVAGVYGGRLRLWDVATGKERGEPTGTFGPHSDSGWAAISPDGKWVASAGRGDIAITIWDATTGKIARTLPLGGDGARSVSGVRFAADGSRLVAGINPGLRSWDAATGKELPPGPTAPKGIYWELATVSPNGKRLAVRNDGRVPGAMFEVLDFATGDRVSAPMGRSGGGRTFYLWADAGSTVAYFAEDVSPRLVDADTGRVRGVIDGGLNVGAGAEPVVSEHGLFAAPSGAFVQKFSERKGPTGVGVWEAVTGKRVLDVPLPKAERLAIVPNQRALVTADGNAVRVWDLVTGRERGRFDVPLEGPWGVVRGLHVSADGRRAVTPLKDGTAIAWDLTKFPPPRLTAQAAPPAEEVWKDLADADPAKAFAAGWRMSELPPEKVVPLLAKELRPPAADAVAVRKLVAALDDDDFAARERATAAIGGLGVGALRELRAELAKATSPEVRDRLGKAIENLTRPPATPDHLRRRRAVGVLERLGTADARKVLRELADGPVHPAEARAAADALQRAAAR